MKLITLILSLVLSFSILAFPKTPDQTMTVGALCSTSDKDFAEFRYPEAIPYCNRDVTTQTKQLIYNAYHIPVDERKQYTIDHLIPLSIGGNNDMKNLWPEHISLRDSRLDPSGQMKLEQYVYEQVRAGKMKQADAIAMIKKSKFNLKK